MIIIIHKAGISVSDMALVSSDSISSISSSAWTNMPVATVNSLSSTQLAGLTTSQVSSLQNSPSYSSFSSSIQNGLTSLATTNSVSTSNENSFGIKFQPSFINIAFGSMIAILIL